MSHKFTKEQVAKYKNYFELFDSDGDGVVDVKELGSITRSMGFNPSEAEIKKMMKAADFNKSGKIDFSSFLDIVAENLDTDVETEDELTAAFKTFDKDGDGYISASELHLIMTNLGEKLTDDEIKEMINLADINGDGKIDYEEFVIMMSKP